LWVAQAARILGVPEVTPASRGELRRLWCRIGGSARGPCASTPAPYRDAAMTEANELARSRDRHADHSVKLPRVDQSARLGHLRRRLPARHLLDVGFHLGQYASDPVAPRLHLLPRSAAICALAPRISARRRTL